MALGAPNWKKVIVFNILNVHLYTFQRVYANVCMLDTPSVYDSKFINVFVLFTVRRKVVRYFQLIFMQDILKLNIKF